VLGKRLIVGSLLIAALVAGLWLDALLDRTPLPGPLASWAGVPTFPPGTLIFVVAVGLSVIASRELAAMLRRKGIAASARANTVAALLGLIVATFVPEAMAALDAAALVASAAVLVLVASVVFHARHLSVEGVVAAVGSTLLAFVYLGLLFGFLLAIRREHEVWVILWVLLVTKSCDIGAYFTGRAVGRHKLIPWLSPGKTWEGLGGGVAVAGLVGMGGAALMARAGVEGGPGPWLGLASGVCFALVGHAGDLMASVLKRDAGVKDSGSALPGMGGILDVLDSPLLVFPAAYWVLTLGA
jgi:phosphatidate cytidylyltransferase